MFVIRMPHVWPLPERPDVDEHHEQQPDEAEDDGADDRAGIGFAGRADEFERVVEVRARPIGSR